MVILHPPPASFLSSFHIHPSIPFQIPRLLAVSPDGEGSPPPFQIHLRRHLPLAELAAVHGLPRALLLSPPPIPSPPNRTNLPTAHPHLVTDAPPPSPTNGVVPMIWIPTNQPLATASTPPWAPPPLPSPPIPGWRSPPLQSHPCSTVEPYTRAR